MKKSLSFLAKYFKIYKGRLVYVTISAFITMYLVVLMPELQAEAINTLAATLVGAAEHSVFIKAVLTLVTFTIINYVLSLAQYITLSVMTGKVTHIMRIDLFKKLEKLPIAFFDKSNDGDILARFTSDLDNISNTLNQSMSELIGQGAMLIITLVIMFTNGGQMSWVVLSTLPVLLFVAVFVITQARKNMELQQKQVGKLNGFVDERMSGQKLVIANGLQEQAKKEFVEFNQAVYSSTFKSQLFANILFPALFGLQAITNGIVIFYGAYLTINGKLPILEAAGTIFLYTQYVRMIYQPLTQIASQFTQMQLALVGVHRILEIYEEEDEIDNSNSIEIEGIQGDVRLNRVSFSYDGEKNVLSDINIHANKGEMVALVGHTGSGKTTIMNLLNRFYNIENGEILFDGINIQNISLSSLREHVGIVLQDSVLFTGTVRDNIAFGKRDASDEEIIEVAKRTHIHDFIMSLEDGYNTHVSESNSRMSVGQKQLISIARTMLVNPDLLILDEATSNVDTVTEALIQEAMDQVIHGRTSFVIAHRLKTILDADKIIVLENGKIIEEGNHETLLARNGHYAQLYKNQFVLS